jgi:hypothetical protein
VCNGVEAEAGSGGGCVGTIAASGPWCLQWAGSACDNSQQARSSRYGIAEEWLDQGGAGDVVNGGGDSPCDDWRCLSRCADGRMWPSALEKRGAAACQGRLAGCVSYDLTWALVAASFHRDVK